MIKLISYLLAGIAIMCGLFLSVAVGLYLGGSFIEWRWLGLDWPMIRVATVLAVFFGLLAGFGTWSELPKHKR